MTDQELLKFAAKAAGIVLLDRPEVHSFGHGVMTTGGHWSPIHDDGDALRLAVKLEIFTGRHYDCVAPACFASWNNHSNSLWEPTGDNAFASTRRAIVRAAAEIGKAMP